MQHVFIIGSKGIPGNYGGYETFVDKLTEYHQYKNDLKYHVACKSDKYGEFEYHNARCFQIKVPNIGPAQAIYYDVAALKHCCKYIKENNIEHPIIYILACRIGPFARYYKKKIHKLGGKIFVNPDGHEWKRAKWNFLIKKYWKLSERLMVRYADLVICDSVNIEKYIKEVYKQYFPKTTYISYGAEIKEINDKESLNKLKNWFDVYGVKEKEYYLIVGRFVPENNYELMIKGFIASKTKKDLVIVTNVEKNKFYNTLLKETHFNEDERIKFVGTVYDQDLLYLIREKAFAYMHGHSVGGTNPSLLEALAATELNLLYRIGFNQEVAGKGAVYFDDNDLSNIINEVDHFSKSDMNNLSKYAKKRIYDFYNWEVVVKKYENIINK